MVVLAVCLALVALGVAIVVRWGGGPVCTIGFIVFAGVVSGLVTGALYAVVAPVLPRGRAGGLAASPPP